MTRIEILCGEEDREGVIEALRATLKERDRLVELAAGVHPGSLEDQTVRERVTGRVERVMLIIYRDDGDTEGALKSLADIHLQQPLFWTASEVAARGTCGT